MQTFLPYSDFRLSVRSLDRLRLGKQRVEAWQILSSLRGLSRGWRNHPAVRMWAGYQEALALYGMAACLEWRGRGYRDQMLDRFDEFLGDTDFSRPHMPPWLGDPAFHASHRSNLLRKDPTHYGALGWSEPPDLPYVWPVSKTA